MLFSKGGNIVKQRGLLILAALLAVLLLVSCGGQPEPAPAGDTPAAEQAPATEEVMEEAATEEAAAEEEVSGEPAPDAPEFIELGAVVPLTGRYAAPGGQYERGYKYAVEDINADGGVFVAEYNTSIPLRLNLLDDESDASKTVNNLETLYSNNDVVAYLGGVGSDLHAAASAIAEKNQVPYLGAGFALWGVHQQGYQYLFSPFWKSPAIAETTFTMLDELVPEGERPLRVAIFQEQTDWGIELGGLWQEEAEKAGYEVVVYEEYAPLTQDFTDLILKAQEAEAQTLLALPSPPDGLTIFKQMGELGYTPEFSLMVRAPDGPTWAEALGPVGDYVTLGPGWHNTWNAPGVDRVNEHHMEEVGRPADPGVGPSYAIVQIVANAIEQAGTIDRAAVRDAIAATDIDTVIGHVTFREDGTGTVGSPILQYINGKQEVVWPTDIATAEFVFPAPPFDER
jgi:branched-chain amino acid transport system substrate-binding protein